MSLRAQVAAVLALVVAVTVACSTGVALVVVDRRAAQVDERQQRAFDAVARAVARRTGVAVPDDEELVLPGVLRPGRAVAREGSAGAMLAIVAGGVGGGAAALALGLLLVRRLRRPLDALSAGTDAVARGQFEHRVAASGPPELRELAGAFNAMSAAIERADGERRVWLDDLAHELRAPVAVIQAYAEALADDVVGEGADREAARRAVAANAAQVGALALALRGEDAGDGRGPAHTDVGEALAALSERLGPAAEASGVVLRTRAAAPGPVAAIRAVTLARVLDNLVGNALRAVEPGRGRVEVGASIERRRDGDPRVLLLVDDDGPGVAPEDRVRAFDRLWRGDAARPRDGGQGLGLAIARGLVEGAGGSVAIADAPLGGARLEVRLPLAGDLAQVLRGDAGGVTERA